MSNQRWIIHNLTVCTLLVLVFPGVQRVHVVLDDLREWNRGRRGGVWLWWRLCGQLLPLLQLNMSNPAKWQLRTRALLQHRYLHGQATEISNIYKLPKIFYNVILKHDHTEIVCMIWIVCIHIQTKSIEWWYQGEFELAYRPMFHPEVMFNKNQCIPSNNCLFS